MTVSPDPSEIWFSTQIIPVASSLKIVPPWKKLLGPSISQPDGNWTGVFTTNWSTETKCPALYLSWETMPFSSFNGLFHTNSGDRLLAWASWNYMRVGMTTLVLDIHLGIIMEGKWYSFLGCSFIGLSLIISCIPNMVMTTFQYHNKSSFCVPDNF